MSRMPLNQGITVVLSDRGYVIDSVLGSGATCIVYSAYYTDKVGEKHYVNLKECYPHDAAITRENNCLLWESQDEQEMHLSAFQNTYRKLMKWQNHSFAVDVFDLCEGNNTLYIVMKRDQGRPFDAEDAGSLHDILKTVRLLAHFVGKYHENGYLHLDVKPSNFLVFPRPSEHIVLFDMDSVVSMADIEVGAVGCYSYSDGWAAPEQKQGNIKKLSPATDIFAIGAVLFEKVMNRQVAPSDMSAFADWNFDNALFDEVNPKVKRILCTIFQKTLAANANRRYQMVGALIEELDQAIQITAAGSPYLLTNCPPLSVDIVGRSDELCAIEAAFKAGARAVFLHGEGGIGKSTVALAYGNQQLQNYDAILFLRYRGSLENLLEEIEIQNYEMSGSSQKKLLHRLLDEHILLIIDNFDEEIDEDQYLEELLGFHAHILFTTRTNFGDLLGPQVTQIKIDRLPTYDLMQMLCRYAQWKTPDMMKVMDIVRLVDSHTYAVELLGKQAAVSGLNPEQIYAKVSSGLESFGDTERIRTKKDGTITKATIPDIIRTLFHIANLSEPRKQALRNLYLLRFLNIDRDEYCWYTYEDARGVDVINDLVELNWVQRRGQYYNLHPLVVDVVGMDLNPSIVDCPVLHVKILSMMSDCVEYEWEGRVEEYKCEQKASFVCAFFSGVSLENEQNRDCLIHWLLGLSANEDLCLGGPFEPGFEDFYKKLAALDFAKLSPETAYNIRIFILAAWLREYRVLYGGEKRDIERKNAFRNLKMEEAFSLAVCAAKRLPQSKREQGLDQVYEMTCNRGDIFLSSSFPEFLRRIYNERPESCEISSSIKQELGIPLTPDEEKERSDYYAKNPEFAPDYTNEEIDEEIECKKQFSQTEDKVAFIKQIIEKEALPEHKRVALLEYCMEPIWSKLVYRFYGKETVSSYNWAELEQMLEQVEEFLLGVDFSHLASRDGCDVMSLYEEIQFLYLIVYSANDRIDEYELTMEWRVNSSLRQITKAMEGKGEHHLEFKMWSCNYISWLRQPLLSIQKTYLLIPFLLRLTNSWVDYYKKQKLCEDSLFELFELVVWCASDAMEEPDIPDKWKMDYESIVRQYQEKMDRMANINFSLK